MMSDGSNLLVLTISAFWSSSRWPLATEMSSRRQKNIPLGGRYRHVFPVSLCVGSSRKPNPCNLWSTQTFALSHHHDDVVKWKYFPRYWPFVQGIHRSPVNSPHEGQWRGALMLSLICVWINGWVNNCEAGDLRRYLAHYDVTVMIISILWDQKSLKSVLCGCSVSIFILF